VLVGAAMVMGSSLEVARAAPASLTLNYDVTYHGLVSIDLGRASVHYSGSGTSYQLSLSFRPSGSAKSLAGPANIHAQGGVSGDTLEPRSMTLDYSVRSLAETRSVTFADGHLQQVRVSKKKAGGLFSHARSQSYDPRGLPALVPLSQAEQTGVIDPLSAMFLPVRGGSPRDRANCARRIRVYDGRRRFDLAMSYQGEESGGAGGPAIVCRAAYVPIAGQSRDGDDLTQSLRDYRVVVALVPVAGQGMLVPRRITVTDTGGAKVAEARAVSIVGH
jgi:hypothetical protein